MPDDFEPDVAGGGEGGGEAPVDDTPDPGGEPADPQGDTPAEDAPTGDEADDQQDDEQTPATGGSEKLKNLLAKYGGDSDKMVDAYWEQAKSLSAMDKKLDALIDKVNSKEISPEQEAKLIADDPDVKEIGAELASLDADVKTYTEKDRGLVQNFGQLETLLKQLEAKLEFAPDDISKAEIRREIADSKREQRDIRRDWENNLTNLKSAERQMKAAVRQYREAEGRARTKRDQAKRQESESHAAYASTRKEFADAMQSEARSYGIAPESKMFAVMNESIKGRLTNYLRSLGTNAEGIDLSAAVAVLVEEYADTYGKKRNFAAASRQKASVTGKPTEVNVGGKKAPPPDKTGKYWDPKWVRERAKRMLG
jgi:hypothetical protein